MSAKTTKETARMRYHSNATTNQNQRVAIGHSQKSRRQLAQQYHVSVGTIQRWVQRDSPADRSSSPKRIRYALEADEERLTLFLRQQGLSLDAVSDTLLELLGRCVRSSVHRLFVRHGLGRLPKQEQQPTGEPGAFKEYGPGFLHIDCFYLPKLQGQRQYCFVAIDRATRLVFLLVYERKDKAAASDFLGHVRRFFPFRIEKLLTDNEPDASRLNGREFTLKGFKNRYGTKVTTEHPFEQQCVQAGIEHRTTRPYTPKTNGMVERANGRIKADTTKQNRYETIQQMKADLHRWFVLYNFCWSHRRIGRKTPYQAAGDWFDKEPERFIRKPTKLLRYRLQCSGT
jgi:transposase InsO family protein